MAHARIPAIDVSEASSMPSVVAILTAEDLPGLRMPAGTSPMDCADRCSPPMSALRRDDSGAGPGCGRDRRRRVRPAAGRDRSIGAVERDAPLLFPKEGIRSAMVAAAITHEIRHGHDAHADVTLCIPRRPESADPHRPSLDGNLVHHAEGVDGSASGSTK
jgi:hypothetical protein